MASTTMLGKGNSPSSLVRLARRRRVSTPTFGHSFIHSFVYYKYGTGRDLFTLNGNDYI